MDQGWVLLKFRAAPQSYTGLVPRMVCGDLCHALCRTTLSKMARNRKVRQSVRLGGTPHKEQRLATKWAEARARERAPERGIYAASAQDELHDVGLFILKTAVGFNSASDPTVSCPAKCYLSVPAGV